MGCFTSRHSESSTPAAVHVYYEEESTSFSGKDTPRVVAESIQQKQLSTVGDALDDDACSTPVDGPTPTDHSTLAAEVVLDFSAEDLSCSPTPLTTSEGLPYSNFSLGACHGELEHERLNTFKRLDLLSPHPERHAEIEMLLNTVRQVFDMENAMISLLGSEKVFVKNAQGMFGCGVYLWRWSFCSWTIEPQIPKAMVVFDPSNDARFRDNEVVVIGAGLQFYAGAPLVSYDGHRLGTLCFMDCKPRTFTAAECNMLCNLAELASRIVEGFTVKQLEQDLDEQHQEEEQEQPQTEQQGEGQFIKHNSSHRASGHHALRRIARTLDCYESCIALLDTRGAGWTLLYTNQNWETVTGIPRDKAAGTHLQGWLQPSCLPYTEASTAGQGAFKRYSSVADWFWRTQASELSSGHEVRLERVQLTSGSDQLFTISFRAAESDILDSATFLPVATPHYLQTSTSLSSTGNSSGSHAQSSYCFMTITPIDPMADIHDSFDDDNEGSWNMQPRSSSGPSTSRHRPCAVTTHPSAWGRGDTPVRGLLIIGLLGAGGFGSVYRATYGGQMVAAKVISSHMVRRALNGVSSEALLSQELDHPHVVKTLRCVVKYRAADASNRSSSAYAIKTPSQCQSRVSPADYSSSRVSASAIPSARPSSGITVRQSSLGSSSSLPYPPPATSSGAARINPPSSAFRNHPQNPYAAANSQPRSSSVVSSGLPPRRVEINMVPEEAQVDFDLAEDDDMQSGGNMWNMIDQLGHNERVHAADSMSMHRKAPEADPAGETWIVMEYCTNGSLQDAIDQGRLRTEPSELTGKPYMPAILVTAYEVASALQYLHSQGIMHGDLSALNVLLTRPASGTDSGLVSQYGGRTWVAKVADFGLSKDVGAAGQVHSTVFGVVTHAAPEVLERGLHTPAADVYSYGVILWQMFTGSRPWAGLNRFQILSAVCRSKRTLQFAPGQQPPPRYLGLVNACLSPDAAARPSLEYVMNELRSMMREDDARLGP